MKGKTVLVTGGNTGIGFETAAAIAAMGARTIITARDDAKGRAAVDAIKERSPDADIEAMHLDLSELSDVRTFAATFSERHPKLDVLINNAGLILDERRLTKDGYEMTLQVNHLGPFLLTNLLLDTLKAAAPSRIVNVASTAHRPAKLDFDDLQSEQETRPLRVYGITKLCNILFTRELARRIAGTGVTAYSLHPGTIRTGFGKDGDITGLFAIGIKIGGVFFKSPASGARTSVHVATTPGIEDHNGAYWVSRKVRQPSAAARNDDDARRLWEASAEMVGI